jgi:lactate permease
MLIWGTGAFKTWANSIFTWNYPVPELHNYDQQGARRWREADAGRRVFAFTYLSFTGSGMLIAAIISGFLMGLLAGQDARASMAAPVKLCAISLITISAMLAIGTLTAACPALTPTLGLAFAATGGALSLLRHAARLVGRGADRIGHGVQHSVRQPAEDHLRAT